MSVINNSSNSYDGSSSWINITENDTASENTIQSGEYTITVEGAFGGGSVQLHYGKNELTSLGYDALFSAAGSKNIKCGAGQIKPVISGGTSMSVNVYVDRI